MNKENFEPVYVVGHRNPDTDAICSAIGYADYLQHRDRPNAIAAACGPANSRTQHVLDLAGISHPKILTSVKPSVSEIGANRPIYAKEHEPFFEVYRRMQEFSLRSMVVVDDEMKIVGVAPMLDLMQLLLPAGGDLSEQRIVKTSLRRVRTVVDGKFHNEIDSDEECRFFMSVGAMKADSFSEHMEKFPAEQSIVVVGNRPTIQKPSIDYGVRLLVVTGGHPLQPDLMELAKKNKVSVLSCPYDTAMTTILIKGANNISQAITKQVMTFNESTLIEDAIVRTKTTDQPAFPVVDDEGRLVGAFSKTDLAYPKRADIILVDHNEMSQAVEGADQANILEVIDHHRLGGDLVTRLPIRFINDTIGSTSTMITRMFKTSALVPDKGIALCLAAGIISDTLNLTSPTSTDVDYDMLCWLETYMGRDRDEYAKEIFSAGSALATYSADEVVGLDCKTYTESGFKFSAAQVEELGMDRFWAQKDQLKKALDDFRAANELDFSCLLVTDITRHYSLLLTSCPEHVEKAIEFPEKDDQLFELVGVVSRKKQLLPSLLQGLNKIN